MVGSVATPYTVPLPSGITNPRSNTPAPTIALGGLGPGIATMSVLGAVLVGLAVIAFVAALAVRTVHLTRRPTLAKLYEPSERG